MKKAIKITVISVVACVVIFLAIGFIALALEPKAPEPTSEPTPVAAIEPSPAASIEPAPAATAEVQVDDDFLTLARRAVEGESYVDEPITDVVLDGRDLRITVDMSKSTLNEYQDNDMALAEMLRGKSDHYTEAVLALGEQYDELWDTITVDFGELGYIVNSAEDILTAENGERYFPSWNYEIQHKSQNRPF